MNATELVQRVARDMGIEIVDGRLADMDSLTMVGFATALEEAAGVRFPAELLDPQELSKVANLAQLVDDLKGD